MKIAIFGATGTVGTQLTQQAMEAGHEVQALVRTPQKLTIQSSFLKVIQGDVLGNDGAIDEVVRGCDAVLVVLGNGVRGTLRDAGTRNIIAAMKRNGVDRLICQSTLGAGGSFNQCNWFWKFIFRVPLRQALADHNRQEQAVRESGLNWTIARPAAFTDGERTGAYEQLQEHIRIPLELKISRADVADFMLRVLASGQHQHHSVSLSY